MGSTASRAQRRSKGFSLLEVIVTLAVLGIGLSALMQLYSITLRTVKKAEDHTVATIQARSLLEESIASSHPADTAKTFELSGGMRAERTVGIVYQTDNNIEYEIRVKVELGRGESVELTGLRSIFINTPASANAP